MVFTVTYILKKQTRYGRGREKFIIRRKRSLANEDEPERRERGGVGWWLARQTRQTGGELREGNRGGGEWPCNHTRYSETDQAR